MIAKNQLAAQAGKGGTTSQNGLVKVAAGGKKNKNLKRFTDKESSTCCLVRSQVTNVLVTYHWLVRHQRIINFSNIFKPKKHI